jgi:hypothetical protein
MELQALHADRGISLNPNAVIDEAASTGRGKVE